MKPFLNKMIDTVTNAAQNAKAGKKLAMGATQHTEEQASGKQSFQSVFKSAQSHVEKHAEKNETVTKGPKNISKKSADKPAKADGKDTSPKTQETGKQPAPETTKARRTKKSEKADQENTAASATQTEQPVTDKIQPNNLKEEAGQETDTKLSPDTETEQDNNETVKPQVSVNGPQALPLALQLQVVQAPETSPDNTNIADEQDLAVSEASTSSNASGKSPILPEADTQNTMPQTNTATDFDTALTQAASSSSNSSIQLDAASWQLQPPTENELQTIDFQAAASPSSPVDDSAAPSIQNEAPIPPEAFIEQAVASGQAEIQLIQAPQEQGDTAQAGAPSGAALDRDTGLPSESADIGLAKTQDVISNNENKIPSQPGIQDTPEAIQAQAQTEQKPAPLAPVPMLSIQVKEEASNDTAPDKIQAIPLKQELSEKAGAAETFNIPAPTSDNGAEPDSQFSGEPGQPESEQKQNAPISPEHATPGKPEKHATNAAVHTERPSADKASIRKQPETELSKEPAQAVSNTPNGAGMNASSDVNMQNISNSAVPVKESSAVNLKDLLAIHANGGEAIDQVNSGIQEGLRVNRPEIVIKLSPENMGDVNVKLSTNAQQQLTARLIASNPETQETLHQQLHQLKQSLESQGIHVEHLTVSVAAKADHSAGQFNQPGSQNQPSPQDENRQQQSTSQQSFQQQQQQAQTLYQQFNQNNGPKSATTPWSRQQANDNTQGTTTAPAAAKPEQRNPNGSISVLA